MRNWILAALLAGAVGCEPEEVPPDDDACSGDPGTICTWAGTGEAGFNQDGKALLASDLYWPVDLTFASDGRGYVLDWNNHRVREVTAAGTFRTVIGTDFVGDGPKNKADLTAPGADGTEVTLNHPTQLLELPDGDLLLVAWHNHKLRRFYRETEKVLVTCGGAAGFTGDGGPAKTALLNQPVSGVFDGGGNLYLVDQRNQIVRRIAADDTITTVAGTPTMDGFEGDGGPPLAAKLSMPKGSNPPPGGGIAIDSDGRLYVGDTLNHRIRRIDLAGDRIDTVAGTGVAGYSGDGGPAVEAQINNPRKLEMGPDGRLYFADEWNHRIRAIDLATGVITTVAGNGERDFSGDDGLATDAALNRAAGFTFGPEGDLYIADTFNNRVRRVFQETP